MKVKFLDSLRFDIFVKMTLLIVVFAVLGLGFSFLFLDDYYTSMKKDDLLESSSELKEIYYMDQEDFFDNAEKVSERLGAWYMIYDYEQGTFIENPFLDEIRGYGRQVVGNQSSRSIKTVSELSSFSQHDFDVVFDEGYEMIEGYNDKLNTELLSFAFVLDASRLMIIETPIAAIEDSVMIARRFFLVLIGILFIVGTIISAFISRAIARPVLRLNHAVDRMMDLRFDTYYTEKRKDEIGMLGKSFNRLSDRLSQTISELNKANERLKDDLSLIERDQRMREEFVSSASHELKTPIAIIQGYAEGLKVVEDEEKRNNYVDVIVSETERMNELILNMLNLSELESDYFGLEKTKFDFASMIDETAYAFNQIFVEKEISVSINNLITAAITADRERMEWVIRNFILNAVHHVDGDKQIQIDLIDMLGSYQFRVFNTGAHIPEAKLDDIWKAFYKADQSRSRAYGGTGLGLAIVSRICERHGYEYGANNREEGVVFWVNILKSV
jgi:signal transduction histidine kinase